MKKNICLIMIATLSLCLTACGKSVNVPAPGSADFVQDDIANGDAEDYAGEGEVQGGIPTDEELAEREAEADSYGDSEGYDYSDANVEMAEVPTGSDKLVPSDNFWQGDDYFDILGYLKASGADNNMAGFARDMSGEKILDYETTYNTTWELVVYTGSASTGAMIRRYRDDDPISYSIIPDTSEAYRAITVDQFGTVMDARTVKILDEIIICLHEYSNEANPLANSGLHYILDTN